MSELIKLISCPITGKIFYMPVIGSDNVVYEAEAAIELIENKTVSPISGKKLDKNIIVVLNLKSLIDLVLKSFENLREQQYKCSTNITNLYHFSKAEILTIFMERTNYNSLLKYDNFKMDDIENYCFADFLKFAPYDVVVHFINHCDNLHYRFPDSPGTWNVINYIFRCGTQEVVKYVLKTYPDLDYENESSEGWRPIHQIASSYDGESVRLILDNGADPLTKTSDNITGFEYIISAQDAQTIGYAIERINSIANLDISVLLIRLDDNEKLTIDEKDLIKDLLVSKYNY
jgi:hypothetical protein